MTTATASAMAPIYRDSAIGNLLIVDDERTVREACREIALSTGYNAFVADSAEHAYKILEARAIDVVLLELRLPGASGLEALREIKQRRPEAIVIVVTGYANVHSAVQAMKLGAYDLLTKPFSADEVRAHLESVADELKGAAERRVLRERMRSKQGFGPLVGQSSEMERLYRIIAKAAQSTHPVLILGESGTGKELVARSIHFSGIFKDKPFVPVDCGSLVPTLIESELFGYVKGAFTGAARSKEGLLAVAEGGTVFLDEIGELPLDLQTKLLRAIQEHEIRPVGSTKSVPINLRVIAATNRNLEAAVSEGRFRRDLFYRLNVLTLRIPPLRERRNDVPVLAAHFLERMRQSTGVEYMLSDDAMRALLSYDWPGNVRELENCLERACAMSSGPVLHTADLSSPLQHSKNNGNGDLAATRVVPLAELEKKAVLGAIEQLHGDKLLAAKLLGIGKTTLYRKLKEYGSQD